MRTMYDGIASDAAAIPTNAQIVAGYVDGKYAWTAADWALFPHSIHVGIAVRATTNAGIVLDCEPGNCTPAESVDWVLLRRAAGADPTVYCNQNNATNGWPAVRAAFKARGVPEPHYWVANYDGNTALPAGAVAKQYASTNRWDLSSVADYWPGVDPAPMPAAAPVAPAAPPEEDDMAQAQNGYATFSWSEGSKHVVQVAFDTIGGNQPVLRAVLLLPTGPLLLAAAWKPDHTEAGKVLKFVEHQATAYGLELQPVGTAARYAASVS